MVDAPLVPWPKFLESHPPGRVVAISGIATVSQGRLPELIEPEIMLQCENETCDGPRYFQRFDRYLPTLSGEWSETFLKYFCRNCRRSMKTFALLLRHTSGGNGEAVRLGEWPPFGPVIPARVISLIGPDRELFLSGRRCENQGFGIGAFAYYRRVVDNQWKRILVEVIQVAKRTKASAQAIAQLEAAREESQFSRAIELAKDAIPPSLLIDGHNPLVLLYSALSEGLHEGPDEECLDLATSIRALLTDLAERIGQALKEERELKKAMSKLLGKSTEKGPQPHG